MTDLDPWLRPLELGLVKVPFWLFVVLTMTISIVVSLAWNGFLTWVLWSDHD